MPKRSSKRPRGDVNETGFQVVQEATGEALYKPEKKKNPAAVALGRLGGKKGGKARAAKLSREERRRIASDAARARWDKRLDQLSGDQSDT